MFRKRFYIFTCVMTLMASSVLVEGLPKPIEYLSEMGSYLTKRFRRGAVNFHRAIACYQPDIMILGTYGTYGCFCGFSGYGHPIDETDKCCQRHDECYTEAGSIKKTFWESLISLGGDILQSYNNECHEGEVICAQNSPYQEKLCKCDKDAAYCFHVASATYHPQLMGIDTGKYCSENANYEDLNLTQYENRYDEPTMTTFPSYENESTKENKAYMQTTPQTTLQKTQEKAVVVPNIIDPKEEKRHNESVKGITTLPVLRTRNDTGHGKESTEENKVDMQTTPKKTREKELVVPQIIYPKEVKPYNDSIKIIPYLPAIPTRNNTKIEILEPKEVSKNRFHDHNHAKTHRKTPSKEPDFDVEPLLDTEHINSNSLRTSFTNGSKEVYDELQEQQEALQAMKLQESPGHNSASNNQKVDQVSNSNSAPVLPVQGFNVWISSAIGVLWSAFYM